MAQATMAELKAANELGLRQPYRTHYVIGTMANLQNATACGYPVPIASAGSSDEAAFGVGAWDAVTCLPCLWTRK